MDPRSDLATEDCRNGVCTSTVEASTRVPDKRQERAEQLKNRGFFDFDDDDDDDDDGDDDYEFCDGSGCY